MTNGIFASEAPKYWERSWPVVPVAGKAPLPTGWTGFLASIPSEEKKAQWIEEYWDKNIGLLLGVTADASNVLVIFDVDDDRLLNLVLKLIGIDRAERRKLLVGKRGKKGATIFVRAPKSLKSTVIKGAGGLGNIDFLAAGKMTVMPPSIHPDTGKPYEVYGSSLLEVDLAELPAIDDHHIKLLKTVVGSEHAAVLTSGTATHDAGVALTAALVRTGATDEEITDIFIGLLPKDYAGNTLEELPGWIASAREKGFDQDDSDAKTLTKALVSLVLNSGIEVFNDGDGNAFATLPETGVTIAYRVGSANFKNWIRYQAHRVLDKAIGTGPLNEATATLEAIALYDAPTLPANVRVAGDPKTIIVDLGNSNGRVVHIDSSGWRLESSAPFKFIRGAGFEILAIPKGGGNLKALREFLGLNEQNFRLLLAFLVNALKPQGPHFILLVEGEQGSGKSFFCEVVKRIIDPNRAMRLRLPDKPQDLMIQAKEYWLLSFDNASGMKAEMSDVLCSLATGGGTAVRKLYSDGDLYVMAYSRPFMINGISGYANRPDLMERAIPIKLSPMSERTRKTEAELLDEFERLLPEVLGALYSGASHALRTYDIVEPPRHLRMADAARWIKAAEEGLGEKSGAIINAIAVAQNDFVVDRVNDDPVVMKLRAITREGPFEGYVGDLFVRMLEHQDRTYEKGLPQTPSSLSKLLDRLRPAMDKAGVFVEFLGKDRRGRKIRISSEPDDLGPPKF